MRYALLFLLVFTGAAIADKPTYEELQRRVAELEKENAELRAKIGDKSPTTQPAPKEAVSGVDWDKKSVGVDRLLPSSQAEGLFKILSAPPPPKPGIVVISLAPNSPLATAGAVSPGPVELTARIQVQGATVISRVDGKVVTNKASWDRAIRSIQTKDRVLFAFHQLRGKAWTFETKWVTPKKYREVLAGAHETTKDEFSDTRFFKHRAPLRSGESSISPYVGVDKNGSFLRFKALRVGQSAILPTKYKIKAGGEFYNFELDRSIVKTTYARNGVLEWFDVVASDKHIKAMRAIVNDKKAVMRIFGPENHDDITFGAGDLLRIRQTLEMYDLIRHDAKALQAKE